MKRLALAYLLALPLLVRADPVDQDFDEDVGTPSIAVGPAGVGRLMFALDVGWLQSGLQLNLGVSDWLDFVLRYDSMLLYQDLDTQNAMRVGFRLAVGDDFIRPSLELSAGRVAIGWGVGASWITQVRGEASLGVVFDRFVPYARLAARGLDSNSALADRWAWETEAGMGLEVSLLGSRQLLLGAEAYWLGRQDSSALFQWRVRVGWVR